MNTIPAKVEIENKIIDVPLKKTKLEMDVKPKIETDFVAKNEFNKGMEIIDNMNIPVKAEMQNENLEKYNCFVCKSLKFSSRNHLIQHMDPTHTNYVEYVFKKNHKSCRDPIWGERSLSKLSTSDKISHIIDCNLKIEPIKEINADNELKVKGQVENSEEHYCIFDFCHFFKQKIPTQKLLIEHINTKHGKYIKKKKKCIKCETSFHTNSSMTEYMSISEKILHMIDCKPIEEIKVEKSEKYYCVICTQFLTQKLLIEHMQTEHRKKIKKMKKCINCEISFNTNTRMTKYINASEKILHMLECFQKNEVQSIIDCKPNKKNSEKKFSCVVCPEMNFKNQQTLSNHIQGRRKRGCIAHTIRKQSSESCTCVKCRNKFNKKRLGNTRIYAGYYKSKKCLILFC